MTTKDSRQRPNFQRNTAAASAVSVIMVSVSDSVVIILLSETPSCWRYSTSRAGTSASHLPNAVGGEYIGQKEAQPHHQREKTRGRNEQPPDVAGDVTETLEGHGVGYPRCR